MKTIKQHMVISMIAFTIGRLSSQEEGPEHLKDRQYLTFDSAMQCLELIIALYQQVSPDFAEIKQSNYLAAVTVDEVQYIILGSYEEWKMFFELKWDFLLSDCPTIYSAN